jgi:3-polyprenyl-4-hydroxybenzoate decarboxylase
MLMDEEVKELRKQLASGDLPGDVRAEVVKVLKVFDAEVDKRRIEAIRKIFGTKHDACRDHCIVQGLAVEVAQDAFNSLEAKQGWQSPAGSSFGRIPAVPAPVPEE